MGAPVSSLGNGYYLDADGNIVDGSGNAVSMESYVNANSSPSVNTAAMQGQASLDNSQANELNASTNLARLNQVDIPQMQASQQYNYDKLASDEAQNAAMNQQNLGKLLGQYTPITGYQWVGPGAAPNGQTTWNGLGAAPGNAIFDPSTGKYVVGSGANMAYWNPVYGTPQDTLDQKQLDVTANNDAANTSLDYLKLISSLNTPANMFQYLKVLQNTPQGLLDVVNRAAGLYANPAAGPNAIAMPTAAQLEAQPGTSAAAPTVAAPNPTGTVNANGSVTPTPASVQSYLAAANNPGSVASPQDMSAVNNVVNPLQWNARNVTTMDPSQKDALQAATQQGTGLMPSDQDAIFKSGLPIYGGPSHGNVTGMGY